MAKKVPSSKLQVSSSVDIANPSENVKVYFTHVTWKGVREVFKCATCGTFRDTRDDMIEHVLSHVPEDEREEVFEKLIG